MKARLIVLVIGAAAALGFLAFRFNGGDRLPDWARPEPAHPAPSAAAHSADKASSADAERSDEAAPVGRFITPEAFEKNLQSQAAMTPQTLEQLRSLGLTDKSQLKLEFFFFTNSDQKAAALAEVLKKRGYEVQHGPAEADTKQFLVTGWTEKMPLDEPTVIAWTREMCQLAFDSDCEFDGWGTNPVAE